MRNASLTGLVLALAATSATAGVNPAPPDTRFEPIAQGFSAPVAIRHAPGDARLFIVEQGGAIRIVRGGQLQPTPFLRIAGTGATAPPLGFTGGGERGLLGLAFHPDYADNGHFYVYYTDSRGDSVVTRYSRSSNPDLADAASGSVVLRVDQDFANHNGGDIHFGADGFLYIGFGDGGDGNDPCNRAQTLQISAIQTGPNCTADANFATAGGDPTSLALLGKMLRIDVDGAAAADQEVCGAAGSGTAPYGIPPGNPYGGADGVCNEVWHAGLRNPYRFSFDRSNGDMWIGDVGQGAREEVDFVPGNVGGLNFGWRCREGELAGGNTSLCSNPPAFTEPLLTYPRTVGASITGGFRYRGPQASLQGLYFFADFVSGRQFVADPAQPGYAVWRDEGGNPSGFGEDVDGELHYADYSNGCIYRLDAESLLRDGFEDPAPAGC